MHTYIPQVIRVPFCEKSQISALRFLGVILYPHPEPQTLPGPHGTYLFRAPYYEFLMKVLKRVGYVG